MQSRAHVIQHVPGSEHSVDRDNRRHHRDDHRDEERVLDEFAPRKFHPAERVAAHHGYGKADQQCHDDRGEGVLQPGKIRGALPGSREQRNVIIPGKMSRKETASRIHHFNRPARSIPP